MLKPELIENAARFLRILAAVERAHSIGSDDDVVSILSGVDPVELREIARELEDEVEPPTFLTGFSVRVP